MKLILSSSLSQQMEQLYGDMEDVYNQVAAQLAFTCDGCPDNCCDSYFEHHTYIEWGYLRQGLAELPDERMAVLLQRAHEYERHVIQALEAGERPRVMCPLNDEGRCSLYHCRLMVCRTHGVPARMTRPDGKTIYFPGCFRCRELTESISGGGTIPVMDRTRYLKRLVDLEQLFLQGKKQFAPRVKVTIAHMILNDLPEIFLRF